jgi:phenylalanine-4-hydroxylase
MSNRYEVQMKKLEKEFMISQRVPQLNELSVYLKNKTGFTLKPTHGILSQR